MSSEANDMMLELFRSEVESHSETLTAALLALEQAPAEAATLERMMRAAHSIKGAARIVGVDPAADVAHVMEDCFVAAQKGRLTITPEGVDVLLKGVDLLVQISAATRDPQTGWRNLMEPVEQTVDALRRVLQGQPATSLTPAPEAGGEPNAVCPSAIPAQVSELTGTPAFEVVVCPSRLDAETAERVRRRLVALLDAGAQGVTIDLGATTDLDAVGLGFLAAARQLFERRSLTLRFDPVSPELSRVLQLTGLDSGTAGVRTL